MQLRSQNTYKGDHQSYHLHNLCYRIVKHRFQSNRQKEAKKTIKEMNKSPILEHTLNSLTKKKFCLEENFFISTVERKKIQLFSKIHFFFLSL